MQLRDHPAVVSKGDMFRVDPRLLTIEPGFNVRDLEAVAAREKLDELKEDIRENGVQDPLEVKLVGDNLVVRSGHRRHKVVMELIAEGHNIISVPATAQPKGLSPVEELFRINTLNSGEPTSALEKAELVRRAIHVFGCTREQVAKRLSFKTVRVVEHYLEIAAMPEPLRKAVRQDEISATNARKMVHAAGPLLAQEKLDEARTTAAAAGRKRVTDRSISHAAVLKALRQGKDGAIAAPASTALASDAHMGHAGKFNQALALLREVVDDGYSPEVAEMSGRLTLETARTIRDWFADVVDELRLPEMLDS